MMNFGRRALPCADPLAAGSYWRAARPGCSYYGRSLQCVDQCSRPACATRTATKPFGCCGLPQPANEARAGRQRVCVPAIGWAGIFIMFPRTTAADPVCVLHLPGKAKMRQPTVLYHKYTTRSGRMAEKANHVAALLPAAAHARRCCNMWCACGQNRHLNPPTDPKEECSMQEKNILKRRTAQRPNRPRRPIF